MNFYQDGSLPFQLICGFSFTEDKCARCDVHAHCENGKCVCVMEVITELGLWENVSVWEVCGNGDQRSSNFWYNLELFIVANRECTMHYMF